MNQRYHYVAMLIGALLLAGLVSIPQLAAAQPASGAETCTGFADLANQANNNTPGLLTNITDYIKDVVNGATQNLYQAFTNSGAYKAAVGAAVTLMIVIFGVGFLIGVVQASFGQVLIRLAKIGIILTLISPTGWQFFSDYAVKFFNDGTDELIGKVMEIGTGVAATANQPFVVLDGIAKIVLSPDMIIAIMGSVFNSGPYGLSMGGLLAFGVFGLLKMLINGLRLYAISFVMRSLMLGVAPLFIVFLLFDKTKQLFSGWVNILVLLSLRPILYFTFISFFLVMLTTATTNMMGGKELCWVAYKGTNGTDNKISFWRFKDKDGNFANVDQSSWDGLISCRLNGGKNCEPFPLNIVDILSFLILVFVAGKFAEVTSQIASEISNSFLNIDQQARGELRGLAGGDQGGGGANRQRSNAPPAPAPTPAPPAPAQNRPAPSAPAPAAPAPAPAPAPVPPPGSSRPPNT